MVGAGRVKTEECVECTREGRTCVCMRMKIRAHELLIVLKR